MGTLPDFFLRNPSDRREPLLGVEGVAFGDVVADLAEPVSGLLGPPYFSQEAILRPISL